MRRAFAAGRSTTTMSTIEQDTERTGRGAAPEGVMYLPKPKMPPAAPLVMLKTSPLIRRALPTRLMVVRAEARARRHWHELDANRRHALRTMSAVVSGTEREGELEALALRAGQAPIRDSAREHTGHEPCERELPISHRPPLRGSA